MSVILPNHILEKMSPQDRAKLGRAGMTIAEAIDKAVVKSERDSQNLFAGWLRSNEIVFNQDAMNRKRTGTEGWPDFTFCIRKQWGGQFCAVEFKHGAGVLSPAQIACIVALRKDGALVAVAHSVQEAIAFVKGVQA